MKLKNHECEVHLENLIALLQDENATVVVDDLEKIENKLSNSLIIKEGIAHFTNFVTADIDLS